MTVIISMYMVNQKCSVLSCICEIHAISHEWINFKMKWRYEYENTMSVAPVHCMHFSTKSPSWMMHFCTVLELWQSLCSRTPFQQYVENDKQLHWLPFWMQTAGLTPDLLQTKTNGYRRGPGPDSRVDGAKFPSHSSEYSLQTSSVGFCVAVL